MSTAPNLAEAVRQAIVANADLVTLGITESVVWSSFAPTTDNAGPWIVFTPISVGEESTMDGDDGLERVRFQLTIGGTSKVPIDSIFRVLARQFNGLDFTYVEDSVTYVVHFFLVGGNEQPWEPNLDTYKLSVDWEVWIQT